MCCRTKNMPVLVCPALDAAERRVAIAAALFPDDYDVDFLCGGENNFILTFKDLDFAGLAKPSSGLVFVGVA